MGALTELLPSQEGIGELGLIMPALAHLSQRGRWVAWIAPPYIPYAPALAGQGIRLSQLLIIQPQSSRDSLWAVEQTLRSGQCGAVVTWPREIDDRALRRLQLAAEAGQAWGLLYRSPQTATTASPAALRISLQSAAEGLSVRILKRRGGSATAPITLKREGAATRLPSDRSFFVRPDHAVA